MRKQLVIILLSFISSFTLAQNTFQLSIDKNDSMSIGFVAGSIIESTYGSVYCVSTIYPNGGDAKPRIVKLSESGVVQWDSIYSEINSFEVSPEIMPTMDDGLILATDGISSPYDEEILVRKINSNGVIEWFNSFQALDFLDMCPTKDGGYLLLGEVREQASISNRDIIIHKIDENGNLLWTSHLGDSNQDETAMSVRELDDQIYVCGYIDHSSNGDDGIMYALDNDGDLIWDVLLPPNLSDVNNTIIFIAFQIDNAHYFAWDIHKINQFDPLTGQTWQVPDSIQIGILPQQNKGTNFDISCGVNRLKVLTTSSPYILKQYSDLVNSDSEKEIEGVTGSLAEIWGTQDGGTLILTGNGDSIQITKTDCLGNIDFWSSECNSKVPPEHSMILYPNPAENEVYVEATFNFDEVVFYSPNGALTSISNFCECPRMTIDISDLSAGVYFIRISSDEQFAISRIVKR